MSRRPLERRLPEMTTPATYHALCEVIAVFANPTSPLAVDQSQLVPTPDDVPMDIASLLACGVITGFVAVCANGQSTDPGSPTCPSTTPCPTSTERGKGSSIHSPMRQEDPSPQRWKEGSKRSRQICRRESKWISDRLNRLVSRLQEKMPV